MPEPRPTAPPSTGDAVGPGRARVLVALGLGALLVGLHLWPWRPGPDAVWLGWLPSEIALRLAWTALAFVYLVWFTTCVWGSESE